MYKILNAEKLSANVFLMDVEAPRVAKHCLPGQFVIVKMDEVGENEFRLQSAIMTQRTGTVTIVFQPVWCIYHQNVRTESRRFLRRLRWTAGTAI